MIIFGTKSTRKTLDTGTFGCPQCQQTRNFDKRRAKQWFHLYFIPLIPLKEYPPYVECKSCNATFVEGVLDANADSGEIRAEFETATMKILTRMAWADGIIEPEEKDAIFDVVNRICAREFSRNDVDEAILLGLSRRDVMPIDACVLNPLQDCHAGELSAVVRYNRLWHAALSNDAIQFSRDPLTRQRRVRHQHQVLAAEVIDNRQDAEPASICQRVRHEIQAPALVWAIGQDHRFSRAQSTLPAASATYLQLLFGIDAPDLLVPSHRFLQKRLPGESSPQNLPARSSREHGDNQTVAVLVKPV